MGGLEGASVLKTGDSCALGATYLTLGRPCMFLGVLGALLCAKGMTVRAQRSARGLQAGQAGGRGSEQSPGTVLPGLTRAVRSGQRGGTHTQRRPVLAEA